MSDTLPIPKIREELHELAAKYGIPRLHELAEATRRRKRASRAPTSSEPMTPRLAKKIRDFREAHPEMSMHQIAAIFNVSQGRVSEAVSGKKEG